MSNQCNKNEFILPLDEICTLSALLGFKKVIGFDAKKFKGRPNLVNDSIHTLEMKSLISFEFDGTLKINSVLNQIIQIVSDPQAIVILEERKSKLDTKIYRCRKEKTSVQIELTGHGLYKLTLIDSDSIDDLLLDVPFSCSKQEENISLKEYKKIQKNLSLSDDETISEVVKNMAMKKYKSKKFRIYKKTSFGYSLKQNYSFIYDDKCFIVEIKDETISFRTLSKKEIAEIKDELIGKYSSDII